jgi:hypothetical protein
LDKPADKPTTLLDELDVRQNEVIHQLDTLNQRIEETLKSWSDGRADAE